MRRLLAVAAIVLLVAGCSGGTTVDRREIAMRTGSSTWTLGYRVSEGDGECIALAIEIGSGILVDERCIETDEPVAWYLDGVNGVRYTWGRIDEAPVDVEQESADLLLRIPDVEGITTFFVSESNQDVPPTITFQVDDQEIARITAVD